MTIFAVLVLPLPLPLNCHYRYCDYYPYHCHCPMLHNLLTTSRRPFPTPRCASTQPDNNRSHPPQNGGAPWRRRKCRQALERDVWRNGCQQRRQDIPLRIQECNGRPPGTSPNPFCFVMSLSFLISISSHRTHSFL